MKDSPLNAKQQRFVQEYLVDLNATQAAIRAGYSQKTAGEQGYDLLKNPHIANAIAVAKDERAERTEIRADDVLKQVLRMTMVDPRMLVDENGNAVPLQDLPDEIAASIQGVEIIHNTRKGKDGDPDETFVTYKYKLADRNSSADKLMKHLGLYEKDNTQGASAVADLLSAVHAAGSRLPTR